MWSLTARARVLWKRLLEENGAFWMRQGTPSVPIWWSAERARPVIARRLGIRGWELEQVMKHHVRERLMDQRRVYWGARTGLARDRRPIRLVGDGPVRELLHRGTGVALAALSHGAYHFGLSRAVRTRLGEMGSTVVPAVYEFQKRDAESAVSGRTFARVARWLEGGGCVIGRVDAEFFHPGTDSAFVPVHFLGEEARVRKGMFWAAVRARAELVLCMIEEREEELVVTLRPPMEHDRAATRDQQVQDLAQSFFRDAESIIRREPASWKEWVALDRASSLGPAQRASGAGVRAPGSVNRLLMTAGVLVGMAAPCLGKGLVESARRS